MGRTLKRVPLDFAWPTGKTWGGYLNPFNAQSTSCDQCEGKGYSPTARLLSDQWYGYEPFKPEDRGSKPLTIHTPAVRAYAERKVFRNGFQSSGMMTWEVDREARRLIDMWNGQWSRHLNADDVKALLDENRLWDLTKGGHVPTPEEVNTWAIGGFGHDGCNQWICVKAECKRLGVSEVCSKCEGTGELWPSAEIEQQAEDWEETEPPTGEGFQLWEDTTEGSPVSPVFSSMGDLCNWCADNATTFGVSKASAAQWRKMLDKNFVCHTEGNMTFM